MASVAKASALLLLIVSFLFVASEEMVRVEGRTCAAPSSKFNGLCLRSSNCASVCNSEGFPDGQCQGARRRCMCLRPC